MFGREGRSALTKYIGQLYRKTCFDPIYIKDMTPKEERRSQEDILILEQNRTTTTFKGIMVFNRKPTREWFSMEDTPSPTTSLEDIFNRENRFIRGTRYHGSRCSQHIH